MSWKELDTKNRRIFYWIKNLSNGRILYQSSSLKTVSVNKYWVNKIVVYLNIVLEVNEFFY